MPAKDLQQISVETLVARFAKIGIAQDAAVLGGEIAKYNRLFGRMQQVSAELKRRPGDQRRALLALYDHPNMQVRLMAAIHTLAVAPAQARAELRQIADAKWLVQSLDAGMTLRNLDWGVFKPT
ncbi:MAG TPA: DUF2019 domain-containing protein [Rhodopseudomonas sp.]|uniref:DUF2019 domain-containing protein n=1 Tax=Rhodopseudomonas sp. TaxID=1078 RepID=UPI002ED986AF